MMRPRVAGPTGTEIGLPVSRHGLTADETVGGVHRDGAHGALTQMLGDFENQRLAVVLSVQGVQNRGQIGFELDVDDRARDLGDLADSIARLGNSSHVGSLPRNQICSIGRLKT